MAKDSKLEQAAKGIEKAVALLPADGEITADVVRDDLKGVRSTLGHVAEHLRWLDAHSVQTEQAAEMEG